MRCPECNQRNSVAAKKCSACDSTLRRKPLPLGLKVFLGLFASIVLIFWLAAISPTFNDPEKNVTNTASNLTGKSKSVEQMMGNIKYFDQAMRQFLQKYGSLSNDKLADKLSTCLPKSLYESHIFELLPNLKLVEIDTALNASNYLISLNNKQTEVIPVIGLDVYDNNSFLPQNRKANTDKNVDEGQLLVLLGHTANMRGHQPRVKVLLLSSTLQSDKIVDLSDSVVPKFYGEGTAKFAPNQKDIDLTISLFSRGQELNVFSPKQSKASIPVENEPLYEQLIWQNNAYSLHNQPSTSKLYALYAAISSLKDHNKLARFRSYLSPTARKTIEQIPAIQSDQGLTISSYKTSKKHENLCNVYTLKNDSLEILAELRPITVNKKSTSANRWYVNSLSITKIKQPTEAVVANSRSQETIKQSRAEEKPNDEKLSPAEAKIQTSAAQRRPTNSLINTEDTNPRSTPTTQATQASFALDLKTNVKLRNGPGTDYKSIGEIQPSNRNRLFIIGKENGWYHVKVDDKEGFIYAGLIRNQNDNTYRNTTIKRSCNVKDDQHHIITNVKTGEHLVILNGLRHNRYKVMLSNGKIGYVTKEAIDGASVMSPPPSVP